MDAFEKLLINFPKWRSKVTYLQITPRSRADIQEYADIARQVGEKVGHINGAYGEASWTPVRYINKAHSRTALAGLYRSARAGLVTPLRDGMNLVAKEYVAAQDPEDPGVLILSRFAGAARELHRGAVGQPLRLRRRRHRHRPRAGHAAGRAPPAPCRQLQSAAEERSQPMGGAFSRYTRTAEPRGRGPVAASVAGGELKHLRLCPLQIRRHRFVGKGPERLVERHHLSGLPCRAGGSRPSRSRLPSCRPRAAPGSWPASARAPCS